MRSSAAAYRPAHHTSRPSNHRGRSSSDPFSDPAYSIPTVAYSRSDAPPLPPKQLHQQQYKKSTRQYADPRDPRMLETAIRDTVTVRQADATPRTRVGRSQTGGVQTSVSGSRHAPPIGRRSYSQDSATQTATAMEKTRKTGTKGKKNSSSHADVIDKLDYTGGGPMFHHDGPFDACLPSRNRHKAKAPMMAWTNPEDDSPMSAAQLRADRKRGLSDVSGLKDSPYPNIALGPGDYGPEKNPKQVDRIAEAWGIHEPEPYEEFFGGGGHATGEESAASSIHGGYEGHFQNGRSRPQGRELRETYAADAAPRRLANRLPPPQPINLPGGDRSASLDVISPAPPSPPFSGSPGAPKRSKSLMQKIRKMRDQPNVPVEAVQGDGNSSPPSSSENYAPLGYSDGGRPTRPTHHQQNSFFGRIGGRNASAHGGARSPKSDMSDSYVYVEKSTSNKALPPRPAETPAAPYNGYERDGYFDGPHSPGGTGTTPGAGIGRKTSILRKVAGAVRGGNK
ncbi:hypothetical protein ACEPAI_860 [Sanghuangporus weigelae]